ncbi:MAG: dienelactone hydrolase family protein [Bacteroidota bacterium]
MTDPTYLSLITERRARIAILGSPSENTRTVWIVFHGYRQLAWYFIKKFTSILDKQTVVAAPEGLSRFYLEGHKRVGASWMTKEDRLNEIEDQQTYLNQALKEIKALFPAPGQGPRICVLGFSQGAATAWRWILKQQIDIDAFVIWASQPPEEYSPEMDRCLASIPFYFVYGTKDQFISPEKGQELVSQLSGRYSNLQVLSFDGTHDLDAETLQLVHQNIHLKLDIS